MQEIDFEINKSKQKEIFFWDLRSRFYWFLEGFIPYRKLMEDIIQKLEKKPNQYILDAGCGIGVLEKFIAEKNISGLRIEAVDFSKDMLKRAQNKLKNSQNPLIRFSQLNLDELLPYKDNIFDAIVSNNVFFALSNLTFTIKEFYRVLKKGGKLVLSVPRPDFNGWKLLLNDFIQKKGWQKIKTLILFPFLFLFTIPFELIIFQKEKEGIYHRFTKEKLENLLLGCGFTNIEIGYSYADQNFLAIANK